MGSDFYAAKETGIRLFISVMDKGPRILNILLF